MSAHQAERKQSNVSDTDNERYGSNVEKKNGNLHSEVFSNGSVNQLFKLQKNNNRSGQESFHPGVNFNFANIQTKLKVSQPGDIHEKEADRVAEQVMHISSPLSDDDIQISETNNTLDRSTQGFMESRLGFDFSKVRIHTDEEAAVSADAANARAYTIGHDIVFGAGQYAPGIAKGKQLLAHELTHVVHNRV